MEVSMEVEDDDLFFADLSKKISLLIMDDDDDDDCIEHYPVSRYPSLSLQGFSRESYPTMASPYIYHEQARKIESKGTGVFIPRLSTQPPRRKHRQGKFQSSPYNSKCHHHDPHYNHRQIDTDKNSTRLTASHHHNHIISYNNSFINSKRADI